jgi:6-pyruvoyl-tetrahydropterin synthase
MPYTIRKAFNICYAHQLVGAFTADCNNSIHGHNAKIELFIQSTELFEAGMLIDFTKIKGFVNDIIMSFDHALIMPLDMMEKYNDYFQILEKYNKKFILFPGNPTAENMAEFICKQIRRTLNKNWDNAGMVNLIVRFHETESGWAEYAEN